MEQAQWEVNLLARDFLHTQNALASQQANKHDRLRLIWILFVNIFNSHNMKWKMLRENPAQNSKYSMLLKLMFLLQNCGTK